MKNLSNNDTLDKQKIKELDIQHKDQEHKLKEAEKINDIANEQLEKSEHAK